MAAGDRLVWAVQPLLDAGLSADEVRDLGQQVWAEAEITDVLAEDVRPRFADILDTPERQAAWRETVRRLRQERHGPA